MADGYGAIGSAALPSPLSLRSQAAFPSFSGVGGPVACKSPLFKVRPKIRLTSTMSDDIDDEERFLSWKSSHSPDLVSEITSTIDRRLGGSSTDISTRPPTIHKITDPRAMFSKTPNGTAAQQFQYTRRSQRSYNEVDSGKMLPDKLSTANSAHVKTGLVDKDHSRVNIPNLSAVSIDKQHVDDNKTVCVDMSPVSNPASWTIMSSVVEPSCTNNSTSINRSLGSDRNCNTERSFSVPTSPDRNNSNDQLKETLPFQYICNIPTSAYPDMCGSNISGSSSHSNSHVDRSSTECVSMAERVVGSEQSSSVVNFLSAPESTNDPKHSGNNQSQCSVSSPSDKGVTFFVKPSEKRLSGVLTSTLDDVSKLAKLSEVSKLGGRPPLPQLFLSLESSGPVPASTSPPRSVPLQNPTSLRGKYDDRFFAGAADVPKTPESCNLKESSLHPPLTGKNVLIAEAKTKPNVVDPHGRKSTLFSNALTEPLDSSKYIDFKMTRKKSVKELKNKFESDEEGATVRPPETLHQHSRSASIASISGVEEYPHNEPRSTTTTANKSLISATALKLELKKEMLPETGKSKSFGISGAKPDATTSGPQKLKSPTKDVVPVFSAPEKKTTFQKYSSESSIGLKTVHDTRVTVTDRLVPMTAPVTSALHTNPPPFIEKKTTSVSSVSKLRHDPTAPGIPTKISSAEEVPFRISNSRHSSSTHKLTDTVSPPADMNSELADCKQYSDIVREGLMLRAARLDQAIGAPSSSTSTAGSKGKFVTRSSVAGNYPTTLAAGRTSFSTSVIGEPPGVYDPLKDRKKFFEVVNN